MSNTAAQDPMQPAVPSVGPRFRPYASPNHQVTKGRYITSNDPRGYIPVYEYPLNGQWIMMDIDDGYILWTGIWKALGNSKADIVKMIDSQPDLAPLIRRVRGGYLKIQGTWMPYEVALRLARRVAWTIRDDLVPLFGPTFPSTCLSPDQPGYGQVVASGSGRRRSRRMNNSATTPVALPRDSQTNWTVVTPTSGISPTMGVPQHQHQYPQPGLSSLRMPPLPRRPSDPYSRGEGPSSYRMQLDHLPERASPPSPSNETTPSKDRPYSRYSPYPGSSSSHLGRQPSFSSRGGLRLDIPALSLQEDSRMVKRAESPGERITLPPIRPPSHTEPSNCSTYALPPISALEDLRGIHTHDSAAVLRRLKDDDEVSSERRHSTDEQSWGRHRSLSAPPYKAIHEAQSLHTMPSSDGSRVPQLSLSSSYESSSCDLSPISPSPSTPRSIASSRDHSLNYGSVRILREENERMRGSVPTLDYSERPSVLLSGAPQIPYTTHDSSRSWSTDTQSKPTSAISNSKIPMDGSILMPMSAYRPASRGREDNTDPNEPLPVRPW